MVDPKQVRIGNWLSGTDDYNNYPMPVCVIGVDAKNIYFRFSGDNFDEELRIQEVYGGIKDLCNETFGIPLTHEILERAGFVNFPSGNIDRWKKERFYLESNWFGAQGQYKFKWENMDHTGNTPNTKIQYLHQLQNLYFSLTGEELEINL